MIGAGAVVAQRLGRVAPHEDGTGVAHLWQHCLGLGQGELQVLRGDAIDQLHRLVTVAAVNQGPAAGQRLAHDRLALQGRQQACNGRLDPIQVGFVPAHQQRLGVLVVLGLGEQVHGQPVGIGAAVGDHQDLRGPGNHVDAYLAEHRPLGGGHVDVARPHDLVDPRHALGAVGQRRHRLGAADGEDMIDAGQVGRRQHQLVEHAIGSRHHHDDLAHTRHMGRDGVHQYRRGIGRLAAGHIDASPVEGRHLLTQHAAVGLGI